MDYRDGKFSTSFTLIDLWINYMKENEQNPEHSHGGMLSWVIFLKVPDLEEERKNYKGKSYGPGGVTFHYGEHQNPTWAQHSYGQSKQRNDTVAKAKITVNAFKKHYKKLVESKRKYANSIGASFVMFENDKRYETYERNLRKDFPQLTGYEIVNFYKIHLLYELAKK